MTDRKEYNEFIIDGWSERLCKMTDELAKQEFTFGSPEYKFQQGMVAATKKYRESHHGN